MAAHSVAPNLVTFSTMMDPLLHWGGWRAMLRILEELQARSLQVDLQCLIWT